MVKYASKINDGVILDIGTALGMSAIAMSLASPGSVIYTIDNYMDWFERRKGDSYQKLLLQPQLQHLQKQYQEELKEFQKIHYDLTRDAVNRCYNRYNIKLNIKLIIDNSHTYIWKNGDIDLLFIDGNHNEVAIDFNNFIKYVKNGGYILFHDYTQCRPVKDFVDTLDGSMVEAEGSMGVWQKH